MLIQHDPDRNKIRLKVEVDCRHSDLAVNRYLEFWCRNWSVGTNGLGIEITDLSGRLHQVYLANGYWLHFEELDV